MIPALINTTFLTDDEARALYAGGDAAHDFDHVWRVTTLAMRIAQHEGADVTVVRLAALLHDVPVETVGMEGDGADAGGQTAKRRRAAHHLAAADYARDLLLDRGLGTEQVTNVVHSIEAHRFRDQSVQPQTIEAQCLYDADKLDSIGAIGIGRAFAYAGAHGSRLWHEPWSAVPPIAAKPSGGDYTPVHEYVYKLRRILATLHTESARRIGAERHRFMIVFFDQLDAEMQGRS
ncbi:MAG: HD domain-containing protein [Caldilineaceae bacterium]|nr:HD domain-containing protein [Caldilineaceae bacterium]